MRFLTPCYHPNVDTQGNICLDILKEKWSALYDVRTILLSIQSLLAGGSHGQTAVECWGKGWWWWGCPTQIRAQGCPGHQLTQPLFPEPNIESPLNTHAAELWNNQVGECPEQNPPAPSPLGWVAAQPPVPVWPHSYPGHCLRTLGVMFSLSSAYKKYVRETYNKQTKSQET